MRFAAAAVALVVVVAGVVVAVRDVTDRTHKFEAEGSPPVTVTAPLAAGVPRFSALPAPEPSALPAGLAALSTAVRIESASFDGEALVTLGYDDDALLAGIEPARDLVIVTFVPDLGLWLPVGDEVDVARRTVSARTGHFSDWALAVVDPAELADAQALAARLEGSTGATIAEWIAGKQDTLDCDPARQLLPATVREPVAMGTRLCQEVLDDGSYRLQYVNTSGMPRLMRLPRGFVEERRDEAFDPTVGRILADRHPGATVITAGESLSVRFTAADVGPDTVITGDTDWSVYFVSLYRLVFAALLLDKAPAGTPEGAVADRIDRAFLAPELLDCADAAADELRRSGDMTRAVRSGLEDCAKEAVAAAFAVIGGLVPAAKDSLSRYFRRLIGPVLALPKLTEVARAEMTGILQAVGKYGYDLDTTVTIRPARLMSAVDAAALPTRTWDGTVDGLGCPQLPAGAPLPSGVPADDVSCVSAVDADLDGNGASDRLVLWRPPFTGRSSETADIGAVAYLDDGTVSRLVDPPAGWPPEERSATDIFDATQVVRLGADGREQVVVALRLGANTVTHLVLAVGADRALHVLGGPGTDRFTIYDGGGAGYSSTYGCVVTAGEPLLATVGSLTHDDAVGSGPKYGWSRDFYRLDDVDLVHLGREGGVARDTRGPTAGSDCTVDGPEIGAVHRAGASPEQTVAGFLAAVLDGDRGAVSRYLAGDRFDRSWAQGRGLDAWVGARAATQTDRAAWRDRPLTCGPPAAADASGETLDCMLAGPAETDLYLRLVQAPTGDWLVAGAVGA